MRWVRCHSVLKLSTLLLGMLGVFFTTTCVAAAAGSTCEQHAIRAQQVLFGGTLDNWEPVNDHTVLIWTNHSLRAHLVKLKSPLHGLMAAPIIVLVDGDHDGRISPCGHDGIILGDGADGGHVASIVSIKLLSARRTVQLDPSEHIDPAGLISA
jgi:hypothetical protein